MFRFEIEERTRLKGSRVVVTLRWFEMERVKENRDQKEGDNRKFITKEGKGEQEGERESPGKRRR